MAEGTSKQRVEVTGHNREAAGRVVHYIRRTGDGDGSIEFHAGAIITDEKNIIADGKQFDLKISITPVA